MEIIIKETSEVENISIIDPTSGVNYISDFIDSSAFDWDEDRDAYVCDRETFDWWDTVVADHQLLNERIADLVKEHGSEAVYEVVNTAGNVDLADYAATVNQNLDDVFGPAK